MKTFLVTGADGFIGRPLCLYLANQGFSVRGQILDNKNTSFIKQAKESGIELITTGDLQSYNDWSYLFHKQDVVVHLAAKVHEMKKQEQQNLNAYRSVNVSLTEKVAKESVAAGVKRLLFISTVKVNGEKTESNVKFKESDIPYPLDAYGKSKLEAEILLREISRQNGLPVVILRLPLVYGPFVRANFLRLIRLVEKGLPLPLKNIDNKRSMIYLENLIDAIKHCSIHPEAEGHTFMVSDCHDISTKELIEMIARAFNKKAWLIPFPLKIFTSLMKIFGKEQEIERLISSLVVDTSNIETMLDWKPPFTVELGIKRTIDWYSSLH